MSAWNRLAGLLVILILHIMRNIMKKNKANSSHDDGSVGAAEMKALFSQVASMGLFTQDEVSLALSIDQGQVSKILRGQFVFPRNHALRIFEYAKNRQAASHAVASIPSSSRNLVELEGHLTRKLLSAWDGSVEGARALGVILDGVAELRQARF